MKKMFIKQTDIMDVVMDIEEEEVMDIKVVAAGVSAMDGEVEVAIDGDEEVLN